MASGVNTCHQPFLTLQNYWAELCFLQPAQQVPLPGSLQELQHLSAVLEGAVGTGCRASRHKPQIPVPSLKPRLCSQTEGRSGELQHRLHCSHPLEGHLQEGSSGCCLRRGGPQALLSTILAGHSFLLRPLPWRRARGHGLTAAPARPCRSLPARGATSNTWG